MNVRESTVKEFINRNINEQLFTDSKYVQFLELVHQGNNIAAAKECCNVTDASLEEAHLAVSLV